MTFSDDDLKQLEQRMTRLATLWDSERKDHFHQCLTLDVAFREATEIFNSLMPLLGRLKAVERYYFYMTTFATTDQYEIALREAYRAATGKYVGL